ncbi:hypothetical protein ACFQJD_09600 [Haloplanus sp. GCM10025708]|uniref:hypothetical protein n=1 Tax=Haloplanus sp. GCM10025708 TaxID=3252679 RepID=UPI00360746A2
MGTLAGRRRGVALASRHRVRRLHGVRSPEEFPDFLTVESDVTRAFRRMAPQRTGTRR